MWVNVITRRKKIAEYLFEVHKSLSLSIEDGMHLKREIVIIMMKDYFSKVRYKYSIYTILREWYFVQNLYIISKTFRHCWLMWFYHTHKKQWYISHTEH